jgi:DNA-directed RNA polymerase subunit RPC12/RpoP
VSRKYFCDFCGEEVGSCELLHQVGEGEVCNKCSIKYREFDIEWNIRKLQLYKKCFEEFFPKKKLSY